MEAVYNNKEALIVAINDAINKVANDRPFGDVCFDDTLLALQEMRDMIVTKMARMQ